MSKQSISLYRNTDLGLHLTEILEYYMKKGELTQNIVDTFLEKFDQQMHEKISNLAMRTRCNFKENNVFKTDYESLYSEKIKIIAADNSMRSNEDPNKQESNSDGEQQLYQKGKRSRSKSNELNLSDKE